MHLAIGLGVAVTGVEENVVDHYSAVLDERSASVNLDVEIAKEFGGEWVELVVISVGHRFGAETC